MTGALHVGGLAHKHQHALLAVFADTGEIHHLSVDGRNVDFEVTGVHDHSHRGSDSKTASISDGVIHADKLSAEGAAKLNYISRLNGNEICLIQETMF